MREQFCDLTRKFHDELEKHGNWFPKAKLPALNMIYMKALPNYGLSSLKKYCRWTKYGYRLSTTQGGLNILCYLRQIQEHLNEIKQKPEFLNDHFDQSTMTLDLRQAELGDPYIGNVCHFIESQSVRSINISGTEFSNKSARLLMLSKKLESIDCSSSKIDARHQLILKRTVEFNQLRHLQSQSNLSKDTMNRINEILTQVKNISDSNTLWQPLGDPDGPSQIQTILQNSALNAVGQWGEILKVARKDTPNPFIPDTIKKLCDSFMELFDSGQRLTRHPITQAFYDAILSDKPVKDLSAFFNTHCQSMLPYGQAL